MPKLNIIPDVTHNHMHDETWLYPAVIKSCTCEQCRYVKNKRKNRKLKRKIRRMLNKKTRKSKGEGKCYTYYWA